MTLINDPYLSIESTKINTTAQANIIQPRYIPAIKLIFDASGGAKLGLAVSVTVPGQKFAPHTSLSSPFCNEGDIVGDSKDVKFDRVELVTSSVDSPDESTRTKDTMREYIIKAYAATSNFYIPTLVILAF